MTAVVIRISIGIRLYDDYDDFKSFFFVFSVYLFIDVTLNVVGEILNLSIKV